MTLNIFDTVIIGASVPGVVAALNAKKQGQRILMVNSYGFPGGQITENLCCRQQKLTSHEDCPVTREIFDYLTAARQAVLYEDQFSILLNPEVVKYQLQEKLLENGIELLWHVAPWRVKTEDQRVIALNLLAKEGVVEIRARNWIDVSTGLYLVRKLMGKTGNAKKMFYCFFSMAEAEPHFEIPDTDIVELSKSRYWSQLNRTLDKNDKPAFIIQSLIDQVNQVLNGRIELIPAEPLIVYLGKSPITNKIMNVNVITPDNINVPPIGGDFMLAAKFEKSVP